VLHKMASKPISLRCFGSNALTEAFVATGMKAGVFISPCDVFIIPALAAVFLSW